MYVAPSQVNTQAPVTKVPVGIQGDHTRTAFKRMLSHSTVAVVEPLPINPTASARDPTDTVILVLPDAPFTKRNQWVLFILEERDGGLELILLLFDFIMFGCKKEIGAVYDC